MALSTYPVVFDRLFSSSIKLGATNKRADGSYFEVQLQEQFEIPKNAVGASLRVTYATIWNTSPNVVTGVNDRFAITYGHDPAIAPNVVDPGPGVIPGSQVYTIPQGLYDVPSLSDAMRNAMNAHLGQDIPMSLAPNYADGRVYTVFTPLPGGIASGNGFHFGSANWPLAQSVGPLIGWPTNTTLATASSPVYDSTRPYKEYPAPGVANMNASDYFVIHCDLVDRGVGVNGAYTQAIAQVVPDVPPGLQIVYAPTTPPVCDLSSAIGQKRSVLRFWLTGSNGLSAGTFAEDWTVRVTINYSMPMVARPG